MNLDTPNEPVPEMAGYVYIFRDVGEHSNEIKVGYSKHPEKRVRQLHTSGTIWRMHVYNLWHVTNMRLAERAAHAVLDGHRINTRREFFAIAPGPHFTLEERHDEVNTGSILWHLAGLIDDALGQLDVKLDWIVHP